MSAAPIDQVLSRLDKVRQRQSHQYSAQCPAHPDKGPSLSIRETPEGSVLLHCFAGCEVQAVVGALGLEMTDLFPPRVKTGREPSRLQKVLTAGQALELLAFEALVVSIVATDSASGKTISPEDAQRVRIAAGRIAAVREVCRA